MIDSSLDSLSPIDGRYAKITSPLTPYFSEAALIRYRLYIEIKYLLALSQTKIIRQITTKEQAFLTKFTKSSDTPLPAIDRIKQIEAKTHHDVKAVEYYLREELQTTSLKDLIPYIHFGLTSEDINNLCYRLMVRNAQKDIILPLLVSIIRNLSSMISAYAALPMLARTHGQPAIPTTLGKELSVFAIRLLAQIKAIEQTSLTGKLNGAVGSFHAHLIAYPNINWLSFSRNFINSLNLKPNYFTTQIDSPDDLIILFQHYHLLNSILIGLCQDIWRYISDDWLIQKGKSTFVGSSTMPQKINPIEFENAEGNLIMANGLLETFSRKLPISRLQRDLSDSTLMRNLGAFFSHSLIAYTSFNRGLKSLSPNSTTITQSLNANYTILGEALQTLLRKQGQMNAYETVAAQFKEKHLTQSDWQKIVSHLDPHLTNLTPSTYLGLSVKLARFACQKINHYTKGYYEKHL